MKKLLIAAFAAITCFSAHAANGDTTWVQAHSDVWLDHYGAHDTTIQFPDGTKSYRKIYMIWTLGKRVCPGYDPNNAGEGQGRTGWCGDWDYTVNNYFMNSKGDTVELSRFITPYARENAPRTPLTWKQRYIFDITDYYPLLKDMATFRINYSGYSWGFTANVKFAFIEGTPSRNVLGIDKAWNGYFAYGGATPIDDKVTAKTFTVPANTVSSEMKLLISGHGADATNCAEFCKKYYQVKINGSITEQKDIWRDNCGKNHLYPQSGTWLLDRANWCPGDRILPNVHRFSDLNSGTYNVDVDFEQYNPGGSTAGSAGYGINAAMFYYGPFNHKQDASLEDIIAPTNYEGYFRENPCAGKPTVEVKNTGSGAIRSITFEYGVVGGNVYYYNWIGVLKPLQNALITMDEIWELRNATGSNNGFYAKIIHVNGSADDDVSNNEMKSYFTAAPLWPTTIRVSMRTNNQIENRWKILNSSDSVVVKREGSEPNVTYIDTVSLGPGIYKLVVEDDGCDGLNWWANPNAGSGNIQVKALTGLAPYNLAGYFSADFGCGFTQEFRVSWPTGIENVNEVNTGMEVYPNPATNQITVALDAKTAKGKINLIDMTGRVVASQIVNSNETIINTAALVNGVYYVTFISDNKEVKLKSKLVIAK